MHQLFPFLLLLLGSNPGNNSVAQSQVPERHMNEAGSRVLFARSAFAHGYRHGYEEGYHVGNIDINMGRPAHTRLSHGLSLGYAPQFGARKSFESGFRQGLKAGYGDGYAGRVFRAVDALRLVAASLAETPAPADPRSLYFDQGFSSGYNDGLRPVQSGGPSVSTGGPRFANCPQLAPVAEQGQPARQSFCEGYQRGQALGHADALALGLEHGAMQAFK
jgi:flagellar biosynthesis/type III secretory pathway protein FliH